MATDEIVMTREDFEREVSRLIAFFDLYADPHEWAEATVDWLTAEYDLDRPSPRLSMPNAQPEAVVKTIHALARQVGLRVVVLRGHDPVLDAQDLLRAADQALLTVEAPF